VGGDDVEVSFLGDALDDAQRREKIAAAGLVVVMGNGADESTVTAARAAGRKILDLSKDEDFRRDHEAALRLERTVFAITTAPTSASAPQQGEDLSVWMSVPFADDMVLAMVEAMAKADPERSERFRARGQAYIEELSKVDQEYRTALAKARGRYFVTDRPIFRYLALNYGLRARTLQEVAAGGGADAVRTFVKDFQIRAIFVESRAGQHKASMLASASGAPLAPLETVGSPDLPGLDSYVAIMRSNLQTIETAFKDLKETKETK
jgi:ABC-type Zn uptake system ZnuABC Zn-binding protein ZnuA